MNKTILIAPLNWGLGHATRCIPIIRALLQHNFIPVIASDGAALSLLIKEFPDLEAIELPSYNIKYSRHGSLLSFKLFIDSPKILKAIKAEQKAIQSLVKARQIDGFISDNRFGVYHPDLPSVYITHQLQVLSRQTTWLSTKLHQKIIRKFDECWIPDVSGHPNLSGKLGHVTHDLPNVKYIGPLSRFTKTPSAFQYDILILLSGPEPQRAILEKKLLSEFRTYDRKVLFVKGIMDGEQVCEKIGTMTIYNYMTSDLLEKSLNESRLIIARSGYTTVMDLAKLGKKAFFIPTPGQFEQKYLAKKLTEQKLAPSCKQEVFTLKKLDGIEDFKGMKTFEEIDFKDLFCLFQGK